MSRVAMVVRLDCDGRIDRTWVDDADHVAALTALAERVGDAGSVRLAPGFLLHEMRDGGWRLVEGENASAALRRSGSRASRPLFTGGPYRAFSGLLLDTGADGRLRRAWTFERDDAAGPRRHAELLLGAPIATAEAEADAFHPEVQRLCAAVNARDWEALRATMTADAYDMVDLRPLGQEPETEPAAAVAKWKSIVDVVPDVLVTHQPLARRDNHCAFRLLIQGAEGEMAMCVVRQYDEHGRNRRSWLLAETDVAGAIAQLEAIASGRVT